MIMGYTINTTDPNLWYRIPSYVGYEYNFVTRQIRSFKNYNKYPYGYILKVDSDGKWTLTNLKTKRVKVSEEEVISLIRQEAEGRPVQPVTTNTTNIFIFIPPF